MKQLKNQEENLIDFIFAYDINKKPTAVTVGLYNNGS
jgi:hypothetical protein